MTDFPEVIDSSLIAAFRACPEKARLGSFEHWKPKGESVHLHFGGVFAKGLEAARRGFWLEDLDAETSVALGMSKILEAWGDYEPPPDTSKTLDRCVGALAFYFDKYPLKKGLDEPILLPSGHRGIEFSFLEPLAILHPTTGNPLLYSGRADTILNFANGVYLTDEKTTTQLGQSWSEKWDLRSQFSGYAWAARRSKIHVNGILVRGVSILKTKYDTLQALTYRSAWEIDRWEAQLQLIVKRMIHQWSTGEWELDLDDACTAYGGCQFRTICKSADPAPWMPMHFERKRWDPLTRTETLLEVA